jgi:hypothetical protein
MVAEEFPTIAPVAEECREDEKARGTVQSPCQTFGYQPEIISLFHNTINGQIHAKKR